MVGKNERNAEIKRATFETDIELTLNLDGTGKTDIDTGIGFFDHMLNSFAKHGFFDLKVKCKGDLHVDCHHSVEDVGIVLGKAITEALGDKAGIHRYGSVTLPMDDALVLTAIDLCGRPYFNYDLRFNRESVGGLDCETVREFFYAVSYSCMMNFHIKQLDGENTHHIIEAAFKAFGRALREAADIDPRVKGVVSAKGVL